MHTSTIFLKTMRENNARCCSLHVLEPSSIQALSSSRRLVLLPSEFLVFSSTSVIEFVCVHVLKSCRVRAISIASPRVRAISYRLASNSCRLLLLASSSCLPLLVTASWHNLGVCLSTLSLSLSHTHKHTLPKYRLRLTRRFCFLRSYCRPAGTI
jgi:hypothetical protein